RYVAALDQPELAQPRFQAIHRRMVCGPGFGDDADPIRVRRRIRYSQREPGEEQDERKASHSTAHLRWLHGGVGNRAVPGASSSGQTITFLPSCHWNTTILCAIWIPSASTLNAP